MFSPNSSPFLASFKLTKVGDQKQKETVLEVILPSPLTTPPLLKYLHGGEKGGRDSDALGISIQAMFP